MKRKVDEFHVIAAAYLSGQQKNQEEIARDLEISQSLVSRLVRRAKDSGILEVKTKFVSERVSAEELARVKARLSTSPNQQILSRVDTLAPGGRLPTLHIYPCHSRNTSIATWRHRIRAFSDDSASDLLKVLGSASVVGVAWGEMVASAVNAVQRTLAEGRGLRRTKRDFIPLMGEPLGRPITQHSSSVLAAKLAEAFDPKLEPGSTLSLAPVPALIPADMTKAEIRAIRNLIGKIAAYRRIYGTDKNRVREDGDSAPLIDRVDAILTSISTQDRPLGFGDDRLIQAAGFQTERLNDLVIGDLCGVMIPRPHLDSKSKSEIELIMTHWTGVRVEHLEACANHAKHGKPGVIVLAIGANKAPVVYEALRKGLIQHLFMDEDLADRLGEICEASPRNV